jgi:hypothetical protein
MGGDGIAATTGVTGGAPDNWVHPATSSVKMTIAITGRTGAFIEGITGPGADSLSGTLPYRNPGGAGSQKTRAVRPVVFPEEPALHQGPRIRIQSPVRDCITAVMNTATVPVPVVLSASGAGSENQLPQPGKKRSV